MSRSIDERVVDMRFDNHDFESKVNTTLTSLDKLNKGLDMTESASSFGKLGDAVAGINLNPLMSGVETVGSKFSALEVMAITAISNITNSAVNAGKRLAESLTIAPIKEGYQEYELKMGSVQTIMAGTGEELDTVMEKLNELNAYADKTIYSFSDMTSNIGKFTNAGVKLNDAVAAIQGVANVAAISGANANEASRAMYNFAQALSAGYVKLIDWKSIENANMATVDFKKNLLEAAVAAGTVEKTADGMYQVLTTNASGQTMKTAISATSNFNDSLAYQWMTTEVLTGTLEEYSTDVREMTEAEIAAYEAKLKSKGYTEEQIKAIEELGMKAADAATQVKTFTQLIDTLKEAVGSGWAETWEIVFGDFEEAKKLWTGVSNAVGGVIDAQSKARNEILRGGLSSGWKQLMDEGVASSQDYKDMIMQVAQKHGVAMDVIERANDDFEASLKEGWVTADILAESLQNIVDTTQGLSREQLAEMGLTEDQARAFADLNQRVKEGDLDLEDYANRLTQMSGRENLIASFRNIWEALGTAIKAVKSAFQDVFPPVTAQTIYNITERVKAMTEGLKNTVQHLTELEGFKNTFRGLFAVIDIIGQAFSAVLDGVKQLISPMGSLADGVLGVTGSFGEWLYNLDQTIRESGVFKEAVQNIVDFLKEIPVKIEAAFQSLSGMTIADALEKITEKFESFRDAIRGFIDGFKKDSDALSDSSIQMEKAMHPLTLLFEGFGKLIQGIWSALESLAPFFGQVAGAVGDAIGKIAESMKNDLGEFSFLNLLKVIEEFVTIGVGAKFMDVLDGFGDILEGFQMKLKGDALKEIATAVGILAASVLVLSLIDADRLTAATVAIGAMMYELSTALQSLNNMSGGIKGKAQLTMLGATMAEIATAMLILAAAMKVMGSMSLEEIGKALVAMGGSIVIISQAFKLFPNEAEMRKISGGMLMLGPALVILATALKIMGSMSVAELAIALGALGGSLLILAGTFQLFPDSSTMLKLSASMMMLAPALTTLAVALKIMGSMSLTEMAIALGGLGGSLLILAGAFQLFPDDASMLKLSASMLMLAPALVLMSTAIKILSTIGLAEMAISVGGLGVALTELAVAVHFMEGSMSGAAALALVAASLMLLAPALKILSSMSLAELGISLLALGGAFAVIGAASALLAPLAPILLTIAGSVALFGAGLLMAAVAADLFAVAAGAMAAAGTAGIAALIAAISAILGLIPVFFQTIADSGTQLIAMIATIIAAACDAIILDLPKIMETVGVLLDAVIVLLKDYLPKIVDAAIDIVVAILNGIADRIDDVIEAGINLIWSFVEGLAKGIENNTERAKQALRRLGQAILNAFKDFFGIHSPSTVMADQGMNIVMGVIEGVGKKIQAAKDKIKELGQAMLDRFRQFKSDFEGTAKDVIGGLVQGIRDKISSAVSAAKDLGSSLLSGLKDRLGIASPSKEMAILGRYSDEGFAKGLLNNTSMVASAATKVGDSATENLKAAFSEIGNDIGMDAYDPTITPVLDLNNVQSGIGRLNSMFDTQRSLSLAVGASADFASMQNANQNAQLSSSFHELNSQLNSMGSAIDDLNVRVDSLGAIVGTAVRDAVAGMAVVMNGRRVGEMNVDYQNNLARRGGL